MPDPSSLEGEQPSNPSTRSDTRPVNPPADPVRQMLAERLAVYNGDTEEEVSQDERDEAYREMVNIFTSSYLHELPGTLISVPENNTGSDTLEIQGSRRGLKAQLNFGKGTDGTILFNPSNFYLVGDETFSVPYIMASVDYEFDSTGSVTISPHAMRLSDATSFSTSAQNEFWERIEDEEFRRQVRTFESEEEMDKSMGITRENWYDTEASTRQYMDLLVASFRVLHEAEPERYPDFQSGLSTLVTNGVDEAMDVLANKQSQPSKYSARRTKLFPPNNQDHTK